MFLIGMKSYGRAPTFLLTTGHEQARSVAAYLAGDEEAARRVELELPETGVCSGPALVTATPTPAACCGPAEHKAAPKEAAVACCGPSLAAEVPKPSACCGPAAPKPAPLEPAVAKRTTAGCCDA